MSQSATARTATLRGLIAVLLWSMLAALTALTAAIPPFELAALCFTIATGVGLAYAVATGERLSALRRVPALSWLLGIYGLLGYHVCYFIALQNAPAMQANLINYAWPLLIVLMSGLLPVRAGGERLRWWHVTGAMLGLAGTASIVAGGATPDNGPNGAIIGYAAAALAALIWSSYSVLSRLFAAVPTVAVTGYCAATAIGAGLGHLLFERTIWPAGAAMWLAIAAQGLGPVGVAFYLWDHGMKHGDIRVLGAAAYCAPILSTLLLTATGSGTADGRLWWAALLTTAGAMLAGQQLIFGTDQRKTRAGEPDAR